MSEQTPEQVAQEIADGIKSPNDVWPQQPPMDGAVYGFIDPAYGHQMVAMTLATWGKIMQDAKTLKHRLDQLSAENIEMKQGRKPTEDGGRIILLNPK